MLSTKRKLTTYGKASSRKKPSSVAYESAGAEDATTPKPPSRTISSMVTAATAATATTATTGSSTTARRQQSTISTTPQSPSPESAGPGRTAKKVLGKAVAGKDLKSDRKRKFSQVSSKAQAERSAGNSKRSSPSAPIVSDDTPSSSLSSTRRPRMTSASSEDADIEMVQAKLSSPPPTPTRAKLPKSAIRATPKTGLPFSPNTMQIWDTILDSDEEKTKKAKKTQERQIPMRLAPRSIPKSHARQVSSQIATASRPREPKTETPKPSRTFSSERPRRRLIDALAEQAADDSDGATSDDSVQLTQSQPSQNSAQAFPESTQASAASDTQPKTNQKTGQLFARPALTPRPHAPKRTYGQNTKVLEEDDNDILLQGFDLPDLASHSLKGKRLEIRDPKAWSNTGGLAEEDDLATGSPNTKIRDIYELRQAGANTRVADEMQDLAEQIGAPTSKPSSSRRAALLRIADEIKNKDFMRHLRDHGIDSIILKGVAGETDVVSAYLILSILAPILSESSSPHIIRLLQDEQIGKVFARLLRCPDSMKKIVQDRKTNLSKRTQSSVLGIHDNLRKLPIWGSAKPTSVSPRSLSIKCLHLLIAREPSLGRDSTIFPQAVTDGLFAVLEKAAEDSDYLSYPETDESIDLCNTLTVLDFYIVSVAGSEDESGSRPDQLLPILADIFGTFLRRPVSKDKALETSILKLTINLTNNNLKAPDICISKGLIPALAGSICSSFGQVLASVSQDHWADDIIDGLVLRLGILINFSEHSVQVRQVTHDCHYENIRPIDEFIRLFLENYRRTAEADSVEKSHLNVGFAYLAVLLGHLCLYAPVRQRFRSSHAAKSMGPLLESIREFVHHHKTMESQIYEGEDGPRGQSGWAEIEALARQLEDEAAYD